MILVGVSKVAALHIMGMIQPKYAVIRLLNKHQNVCLLAIKKGLLRLQQHNYFDI